MTALVVWWFVREDGACHAFSRFRIGHGQPVLTTVCQKDTAATEVERQEHGPKCLACKLLVDLG